MAAIPDHRGSSPVDAAPYVPLLLTRRAELLALRDLSWRAKQRITPLLVVAPVAWSYDADGPAVPIAEHVDGLPERLAEAWNGRRAFIDTQFVPDDEQLDDDGPVLRWLVREADALGLELVPVTGLRRSSELEQAVAEVASWGDRGLCLRLTQSEWPTRTGPVEFRRLLGRLQADPSRIDLVLDLGDVAAADEEALASSVFYELAVLPFPDAWRSVTVMGSSIPMLHPVGVRRVHRREWTVYRRLVRDQALPRRASFGDYGVVSPDPRADIDVVVQHSIVTVRHTVGDDVVIARGHLHEPIPGGGTDGRTVPAAALWVRSNPDFIAGHCAFEDAVQAAAALRHGQDVQMEWRRLALRHHLEVVAEQVAGGVRPPERGSA